MNKTPEAPKIEFPCESYVIKVVGDNHPELKPFVTDVLSQYDERVHIDCYKENPSKNGRFVSLTVRMRIEKLDDLRQLHEELKVSASVKMVL
ncbi:HP0495 family protein [Reinekea marinisedimentorum]|uniref:Uncharacterized protein n=1 Tax=Reinekea marinisedimentorum TaxID=230495 RepID=A0A4R3I6F5_9GAMM|nr:DUF493 domain-containing protein [Reinekea marinisedimentorum]TCS41674.1 hypothetical protein BCF53_105101 [Reinekea marinisedimentorum]